MRKLTIEAYERLIDSMVARRLLDRSDLDKPWVVTSALFADLFDDYTVDWLRRHGWRVDGGEAEEIIAAVNELIAKLPP
jgi:hypothetical protein